MGNVYLVEKHGIAFPFVLKSYQEINPLLEQLFVNEVRNWTSFGVHQNIVKAFFAEEIENKVYVAAEYVEGQDGIGNRLTNYIEKNLPLHLITKWAIQFTYGMNHCIGKGMIAHSDIKPDNILIDKDLNLKITDFGLSKSYLDEDKNAGGTPLYYSPEQIYNPQDIDHRSDIYSFGIVLYQLITKGSYPYVMSSPDIRRVHLIEKVKPINHVLFDICSKCLEKKVSDRYQNYQDIFKDLALICKKEKIEVPKQIITRDDKLEELYNISCSLSAIGQRTEALNAINSYLIYDKEYTSAWTQKGRLEFELGNYESAIEATLKAIQLYQYNSTAFNNLGVIYLEQNRLDLARKYLMKAVENNPFNSGAFMNLANAFSDNNEYQDSAKCILRSFELTPEKNNLHKNARNLLPQFVQHSLFKESTDIYYQLKKHDKLSIHECFNFAMCLMQVQNYQQAITEFLFVLDQSPKDEKVITNLSQSYFYSGKSDLAISTAEKLITENINQALGMSLKAQYLQASGKFQQADKYLKEILEKYPYTDYLWKVYGDLCYKEEMFFESLSYYKKAKQIKIQKGDSESSSDMLYLNELIIKAGKKCNN